MRYLSLVSAFALPIGKPRQIPDSTTTEGRYSCSGAEGHPSRHDLALLLCPLAVPGAFQFQTASFRRPNYVE